MLLKTTFLKRLIRMRLTKWIWKLTWNRQRLRKQNIWQWCHSWVTWNTSQWSKLILGIGLLQHRRPELILLRWMHEHKTSSLRRQIVIDDHFFPLAEPPDVETKRAAVAFGRCETLISRDDSVQKVRVLAQGRYGSQEPAVTCSL